MKRSGTFLRAIDRSQNPLQHVHHPRHAGKVSPWRLLPSPMLRASRNSKSCSGSPVTDLRFISAPDEQAGHSRLASDTQSQSRQSTAWTSRITTFVKGARTAVSSTQANAFTAGSFVFGCLLQVQLRRFPHDPSRNFEIPLFPWLQIGANRYSDIRPTRGALT